MDQVGPRARRALGRLARGVASAIARAANAPPRLALMLAPIALAACSGPDAEIPNLPSAESLMVARCTADRGVDRYAAAPRHKAMAAYVRGAGASRVAGCVSASGAPDAAAARAAAMAACAAENAANACRLFAENAAPEDWVLAERPVVVRPPNVVAAAPEAPPPAPDAAGRVGPAGAPLLGYGIGASGGGASRSAGEAASARVQRCARATAYADRCHRNWRLLGGGLTGDSGSQHRCYQKFLAIANEAC